MPHTALKSEQQSASEQNVEDFAGQLGPFVVAANMTRMPMVFTDAKTSGNPIIFANASFADLSGYSDDAILGEPFNFMLADPTDQHTLDLIDGAFENSPKCDLEICYRRKDGSDFWACVLISPVMGHDGTIVQHFASFVDMTRHIEAQKQSKMLINELNHRVKNTLVTVQSIVAQCLRMTPTPDLISALIQSRLFALSRSHDLLTQSKWQGTRLRELIKIALEPFGLIDAPERFTIFGSEILLAPRAILAVGIALHELATNAVKYGALSNNCGRILLSWTIDNSAKCDRLILDWQECGGPTVRQPGRKGFGSDYLENGLAHELQAAVTLSYRQEGMHCMIDFPLPPGTDVE